MGEQQIDSLAKEASFLYPAANLTKQGPNVYSVKGRSVRLEVQHKDGVPSLVVCDGPLRQPFVDYVHGSANNEDYDVPIVQSALHAIPEGARVSFEEVFPDTRAEAMLVACMEAQAREELAQSQLAGGMKTPPLPSAAVVAEPQPAPTPVAEPPSIPPPQWASLNTFGPLNGAPFTVNMSNGQPGAPLTAAPLLPPSGLTMPQVGPQMQFGQMKSFSFSHGESGMRPAISAPAPASFWTPRAQQEEMVGAALAQPVGLPHSLSHSASFGTLPTSQRAPTPPRVLVSRNASPHMSQRTALPASPFAQVREVRAVSSSPMQATRKALSPAPSFQIQSSDERSTIGTISISTPERNHNQRAGPQRLGTSPSAPSLSSSANKRKPPPRIPRGGGTPSGPSPQRTASLPPWQFPLAASPADSIDATPVANRSEPQRLSASESVSLRLSYESPQRSRDDTEVTVESQFEERRRQFGLWQSAIAATAELDEGKLGQRKASSAPQSKAAEPVSSSLLQSSVSEDEQKRKSPRMPVPADDSKDETSFDVSFGSSECSPGHGKPETEGGSIASTAPIHDRGDEVAHAKAVEAVSEDSLVEAVFEDSLAEAVLEDSLVDDDIVLSKVKKPEAQPKKIPEESQKCKKDDKLHERSLRHQWALDQPKRVSGESEDSQKDDKLQLSLKHQRSLPEADSKKRTVVHQDHNGRAVAERSATELSGQALRDRTGMQTSHSVPRSEPSMTLHKRHLEAPSVSTSLADHVGVQHHQLPSPPQHIPGSKAAGQPPRFLEQTNGASSHREGKDETNSQLDSFPSSSAVASAAIKCSISQATPVSASRPTQHFPGSTPARSSSELFDKKNDASEQRGEKDKITDSFLSSSAAKSANTKSSNGQATPLPTSPPVQHFPGGTPHRPSSEFFEKTNDVSFHRGGRDKTNSKLDSFPASSAVEGVGTKSSIIQEAQESLSYPVQHFSETKPARPSSEFLEKKINVMSHGVEKNCTTSHLDSRPQSIGSNSSTGQAASMPAFPSADVTQAPVEVAQKSQSMTGNKWSLATLSDTPSTSDAWQSHASNDSKSTAGPAVPYQKQVQHLKAVAEGFDVQQVSRMESSTPEATVGCGISTSKDPSIKAHESSRIWKVEPAFGSGIVSSPSPQAQALDARLASHIKKSELSVVDATAVTVNPELKRPDSQLSSNTHTPLNEAKPVDAWSLEDDQKSNSQKVDNTQAHVRHATPARALSRHDQSRTQDKSSSDATIKKSKTLAEVEATQQAVMHLLSTSSVREKKISKVASPRASKVELKEELPDKDSIPIIEIPDFASPPPKNVVPGLVSACTKLPVKRIAASDTGATTEETEKETRETVAELRRSLETVTRERDSLRHDVEQMAQEDRRKKDLLEELFRERAKAEDQRAELQTRLENSWKEEMNQQDKDNARELELMQRVQALEAQNAELQGRLLETQSQSAAALNEARLEVTGSEGKVTSLEERMEVIWKMLDDALLEKSHQADRIMELEQALNQAGSRKVPNDSEPRQESLKSLVDVRMAV